jgi:hypothetical protein
MNSVCGIHFRRREIRNAINTVKQMTGELLEVFDLADPFHFVDDSIQDRLDFLVRLFLKERTLALETALVPHEFFFVKIRDSLSFSFFDSHEVRHYNSKFR